MTASSAVTARVPFRSRYHRIDGWRGYRIPSLVIVGASDTGMADDSPCPSSIVKEEIERFRREVLKPLGIRSRLVRGGSSNVFCGKRWLRVSAEDFPRAAQAAVDWLARHRYDTQFIHEADLDALNYHPSH